MSAMRHVAQALIALVALTGCYHATIDTGRPVSEKVIDKPWTMSFVYGLVPPAVVSTAQECPNGLAKVETEHTFLNQVVGMVTFGIVTPMHVRVSCASGAATAARTVGAATYATAQDAVARAAELAAESEAPVMVQF